MNKYIKTKLNSLYNILNYFNNLLLIPMFTVMIFEMIIVNQTEQIISLNAANLWFCMFFLLEWVLGFVVTQDRKGYVLSVEKCLDLISSIPLGYIFQGLRLARLIRVLRVVRIILRARRFRGKGAKLLRVLGIVGSTVFAGGLALRIVEPQTVTGLGDSLWWSVITVSTVGYGDIAPVTGTGRIVAAILVFVGIGVFGYIAGFMTSLMEDPEENEMLKTLKRIDEKLSEIQDNK